MIKKTVFYTKIIIEGFGSFGNSTKITLDRVGINLVKGANGEGKSTIFNALLWCEYGLKIKKNIPTWKECRSEKFRGTRVVIDRTDGVYDYRVARHLKFKGTTAGLLGGDKLMIFKKTKEEPKFTDAHLIGDGLHKDDMQQLIVKQLGMSERAYTNSVIFGQRVLGLVKSDNATKRKLFETLFAVDFVDGAKEKAKARLDALNLEEAKLNHQFNTANSNIQQARDFIEAQEQREADFIEDKASRIELAEQYVQSALDAESSLIESIESLPEAVQKLKQQLKRFNSDSIEIIKKEYEELSEQLNVHRNNLSLIHI